MLGAKTPKFFNKWVNIGIIIYLVFAVYFIYDAYAPRPDRHICEYCGDQINGKQGHQIKDIWVCEECWTHWDFEASKIWGIEYCRDRMKWVYEHAGGNNWNEQDEEANQELLRETAN